MDMFNTVRFWVALAIGIASLMSYSWAEKPVSFKDMPSLKVGAFPSETSVQPTAQEAVDTSQKSAVKKSR
jgi:hypothetical protein